MPAYYSSEKYAEWVISISKQVCAQKSVEEFLQNWEELTPLREKQYVEKAKRVSFIGRQKTFLEFDIELDHAIAKRAADGWSSIHLCLQKESIYLYVVDDFFTRQLFRMEKYLPWMTELAGNRQAWPLEEHLRNAGFQISRESRYCRQFSATQVAILNVSWGKSVCLPEECGAENISSVLPQTSPDERGSSGPDELARMPIDKESFSKPVSINQAISKWIVLQQLAALSQCPKLKKLFPRAVDLPGPVKTRLCLFCNDAVQLGFHNNIERQCNVSSEGRALKLVAFDEELYLAIHKVASRGWTNLTVSIVEGKMSVKDVAANFPSFFAWMNTPNDWVLKRHLMQHGFTIAKCSESTLEISWV